MKKQPSLKAIAYHEAGHAVAHHFFGVPFHYATIEPDNKDDSLGHVQSRSLPKSFDPENIPFETRERIDDEIMVFLAGQAAEYKITKKHNWSGAETDYHNAIGLAYYLRDSTRQMNAYMDLMVIRAEDWVSKTMNWLAIKQVARELIKKQRLSSKEVRTAVSDSIKRRAKK